MKTVAVVIPIYRDLHPWELFALNHNVECLQENAIFLVTPQAYPAIEIRERFPVLRHVTVSDDWLGTKNGIQGYNEMMTSPAFYELFADYDYMLICQVDAWIFKPEELQAWAEKDYDYIGAPWFVHNPCFYRLAGCFSASKKKHFALHNKVGNGGLSLRKIRTLIEALKTIPYRTGSAIPEDVFFALHVPHLKMPSAQEALAFAFDTKPAYCYKKNNNRLPWGCHDWYRPSKHTFWKTWIQFDLNI